MSWGSLLELGWREQRKRERDLLEEAERDTHVLALEVRTQGFMLQSLATCLFTASVSPLGKPWEGDEIVITLQTEEDCAVHV